MTGQYKTQTTCAAGMARIEAVKRSLDRDGIPYQVHLDGDSLVLRASGQGKHKRRPAPKVSSGPPELTLEQCERRRAETEKERQAAKRMLPGRIKERVQPHEYWAFGKTPAVRARQQTIGHAVAFVLARHGAQAHHNTGKMTKDDYARLDAACGRRVKRDSQVPERCANSVEWVVRFEALGKFDRKPVRSLGGEVIEPVNPITEYLKHVEDVAYWTEMVRLAGDRKSLKGNHTERVEVAA